MAGIVACGSFVPRLRLGRGRMAEAMGWLNPGLAGLEGERSVCSWDEDSLTMAVEACRTALANAGSSSVERLGFASTTFPFADRSNATVVATALGLEGSLRTLDLGGSQRAGTGALAQALAECDAPAAGRALIVAADRRLARPGSAQEARYGHGAAACVVGAEDGIATLAGARHYAADFVDHYRAADGSFDYALEDRWVREAGWLELVPKAVTPLLAEAGVEAAAIDHLVVAAPPGTAPRLAAALGIRREAVADPLEAACGDTGCGHALLMLAQVLDSAAPEAWILVVGFGQGVDALLFRATAAVAGPRPVATVAATLAARTEETSYTRFLAHCGLLSPDFGMRAERDNRTAQSVLWRKRDAITAFTGGRCRACGTVQFPPSRVCVNPACRQTDTQEPHRLADSAGRIKTFTEDWLAYSARPPLIYGNVEFAEGGNAFIEFADFAPSEARVGAPVRFVFRLKDVDRLRGFRRYFWKAAPARKH
jgi:hydroxymethylglutaryl-CoA synthase